VIVTDIAMPELNGVDALLALQKAGYSFKVIFLTMLGDTEMALQALRAVQTRYGHSFQMQEALIGQEAIARSTVMAVVVSPGYLASQRCRHGDSFDLRRLHLQALFQLRC
jgi:DNA-binding NarL/FixJ family response regulator